MVTTEGRRLEQLKTGLIYGTVVTFLMATIGVIYYVLFKRQDNNKILIIMIAILLLALFYGITLAAVRYEWPLWIKVMIVINCLDALRNVVMLLSDPLVAVFGIALDLLWCAGFAKLLQLIKLKEDKPHLFSGESVETGSMPPTRRIDANNRF